MVQSTAQEGYVAVTGGRVWYRMVGSGNAIPLLTLHGGPGYPHDYLEPLENLAGERRVIFYDQLGCGRSDRPEDLSLWRIARFVEEMGQVRAALGLHRVHLLGHSWGTMLATDYVLTRPAGLVSLILASPALSIPRWMADADKYRRALPAEVREVLDRHEAADTMESEDYQAATMQYYMRHVCRIDPWPGPLQRTVAGAGLPVYNTMWGPSEFLVTGNLSAYDRTGRLREITLPTLVTCGRHDEATPETTARYASLIPGSELAVFDDSAHMPHLEETARFLQVVRDFLARAENTPR
ncbi:MAG: proline iminopeptidase-family hydrolase [Armatimonadetes bacterium]|nr:proline iminopeptidase-family hydrolase [Armatimonadota bacterium]